MPLQRSKRLLFITACWAGGLAAGGIVPAAEQPPQTPAPLPAAAPSTEPNANAVDTPDAERYTLPAGGADALVKFIDQLQTFRPSKTAEIVAYREQAPVALKAAAERILQLDRDQNSVPNQKARGVLLQLSVLTVDRASPDERRKLFADTRAYLTGKERSREDAGLAMVVASGLEHAGAEQLASEAYQAFGSLFAASPDPQLASVGELFAGAARRLQLVGQPLELAGTRLEGTKFGLSELQGRVVLIDFWATWCEPCRDELPLVKRAYARYHTLGFEVVGVSVDRERKALEQFLAVEKVPWITLHERDQGGENPATRRYGILGIPSMFLVGRDGKVLSTHARGDELTRLLAEQFSEVQTQ